MANQAGFSIDPFQQAMVIPTVSDSRLRLCEFQALCNSLLEFGKYDRNIANSTGHRTTLSLAGDINAVRFSVILSPSCLSMAYCFQTVAAFGSHCFGDLILVPQRTVVLV
jgi:hypothetical protein